MKRIYCLSLAILLAALCAAAQNNAPTTVQVTIQNDMNNVNMQVEKLAAEAMSIGPDKSILTEPVTGAPYSADEVTTFTDALADGTSIRQEDKVTVYRDSQGRLRRETPTQITISDPVAGVAYTLDPNKLTARKMAVMTRTVIYSPDAPAKKTAEAGTMTKTLTGGPNTYAFVNGGTKTVVSVAPSNRQSLGTQSFDGVLAEGTSSTSILPAGSIGNDRDIHVVDERWYSSDLKTATMTKHSDPRSGESIFRLTNIHRGEPSPDLFQVPAAYQVIGK